ncbi:hypothetical protein B0H16DRAFT_1694727 [Mycena metata]|uniref:Uncharacterized protein n=1 Tax=Mycena metata TaxID=1033252 RepID=A0AAD7ICG3_9AGAR|nr:hypothetical protein B0H16DRAFT_1694727 [Mycena metata]
MSGNGNGPKPNKEPTPSPDSRIHGLAPPFTPAHHPSHPSIAATGHRRDAVSDLDKSPLLSSKPTPTVVTVARVARGIQALITRNIWEITPTNREFPTFSFPPTLSAFNSTLLLGGRDAGSTSRCRPSIAPQPKTEEC